MAINTGVSKDGQVGQTVAQIIADGGARQVLPARGSHDLELWTQERWDLDAEVLTVAANLTDEQAVQEYKYFGLSD